MTKVRLDRIDGHRWVTLQADDLDWLHVGEPLPDFVVAEIDRHVGEDWAKSLASFVVERYAVARGHSYHVDGNFAMLEEGWLSADISLIWKPDMARWVAAHNTLRNTL